MRGRISVCLQAPSMSVNGYFLTLLIYNDQVSVGASALAAPWGDLGLRPVQLYCSQSSQSSFIPCPPTHTHHMNDVTVSLFPFPVIQASQCSLFTSLSLNMVSASHLCVLSFPAQEIHLITHLNHFFCSPSYLFFFWNSCNSQLGSIFSLLSVLPAPFSALVKLSNLPIK